MKEDPVVLIELCGGILPLALDQPDILIGVPGAPGQEESFDHSFVALHDGVRMHAVFLDEI